MFDFRSSLSSPDRPGFPGTLPAAASRLVYGVIVLATLGVLLADFLTPLGVAVWVLYIIPLALCLNLWWPPAPLLMGGVATALMVLSWVTDEGTLLTDAISGSNRLLGLAVIWAVAAIGYYFLRFKYRLRCQEWLRLGQAGLSEAVSGEQNLEELGDSILRFLAGHLDINAAALFVREQGRFLRRGTWCAPPEAVPESFDKEDGLLGQAVRERRIFEIEEVPEGYLAYGSGFGQAPPRHLLVLPAWSSGSVNAVLELGLDAPADELAREFLELLAEPISIAVRSASYRSHLQELLAETQKQKEKLQAQEEELRVSNEELEEQSRNLQESQSRLEQQQAELEQTNAQLEEQTQLLERQRDELARAQTSLKDRTADLERASQYKSDFLANMSHELRTPLNSSLILAKLLADNPGGNLSEEQVRYAQTIESAGNDLLTLINDILDLSKIEAGHMEIQPETLRVEAMIHNLSRTFEPLAQQKGVAFAVEVEESAPERLETDGKRLEQVLKNLLSNALKFTEEGEVRLTVRGESGDRVAFAVSDTGIGIEEEHRESIFEAFQQADGTTSRRYGGTGLGLSVSRELARLLGGEIRLESTPGEGSTFTASIPRRYSEEATSAREPASASPVGAGPAREPSPAGSRAGPAPTKDGPGAAAASAPEKRPLLDDDRDRLDGSRVLLVVEDELSFARILYNIAHELGFRCLVAETADEALAMIEDYMPDAVLLDVRLPDHSGLSVLDRLKQNPRTRHIPVHVISGEDYSQKAFSLGAISYLVKPVRKEELTESLRQLERRLSRGMRRILVVEDDPVQRDSLEKLLGSKDVETVGVGTAADCLEQLRAQTFDCLVLDLSLPDASGFSLLETLSEEEQPHPPVIVYTGRDLKADEEQQLRRYSKSIIIKGAKSPERLLDEVTLFLHQVVTELPEKQQDMLKQARHRDAVLEGRRILVVEDDIRNVFSLTSILESRGALVDVARNGRESLEVLEKAQDDQKAGIDLVLMDVMMPEMDGLTATREIRRRDDWRKLPVIMLTAKAMKGDQENCLAAGANDYMAKPIDVDQLLSLVRVWLPR